MAECVACGAVRALPDAPCPQCGSVAQLRQGEGPTQAAPATEGRVVPDLDLPRAPRVPRAESRPAEQEQPIELAVEPTALAMRRCHAVPSVGDLAFDAKLLADYGEPPKHWLLRPMYAWRVLWRRRELKRALLVRREEAKRAAGEVEDLLVAVADQVRSDAEKRETFHVAIEHLRVAEDLLRSRDRVFAEEQDAQRARLTQFDSRLRALESELATAQAEERAIAADLAAVQAALARAETLRKRGDSMKRSAIVAGAERTGNERG